MHKKPCGLLFARFRFVRAQKRHLELRGRRRTAPRTASDGAADGVGRRRGRRRAGTFKLNGVFFPRYLEVKLNEVFFPRYLEKKCSKLPSQPLNSLLERKKK
jgi:hypothetical protein